MSLFACRGGKSDTSQIQIDRVTVGTHFNARYEHTCEVMPTVIRLLKTRVNAGLNVAFNKQKEQKYAQKQIGRWERGTLYIK